VLRTGIRLEDALSRASAGDDAPLARAIATSTFRRFGTIWQALEERLDKGVPGDPGGLALLATGAAQVLLLDVPDHAAVDLSVRLARESPRFAHMAGVVNAVLRRLARERDGIMSRHDPFVDTPDWLAARWVETYGRERAAGIAAAHRAGAALDLSVKANPEAWAERLGAVVLPTGSIRLSGRAAVQDLPGYSEGGVVGAGCGRGASRTAPGRIARRACGRPLRGAWGQDGAACGGGRQGHGRRPVRRPPGAADREPGAARALGRDRVRRRARVRGRPVRRDSARCALHRHRHHPPAS
jgi:hypothetical protein